jgi:phage gp36-like protein
VAAYCVRADVNLDPTRLAELTDSAAAVGSIDGTVETQVLEDASRELDGYLDGTYATPIAGTPPAIVRTWTAAIARWRFYARRPEMDPPRAIQLDYERTIKMACEAGQGRFALPLARVSGATDPESGASMVVHDSDDTRRVFGRARDC